MSDELKPCPFCGGEAELMADHDNAWANCPECQISLEGFETEIDAITAWNTRADLPAPDPMDDPRVQALVEALEWIKTYRKACHNYDDDTDQARRNFDECDFEIVEEKATDALAAMEPDNG